LEKGEEIPNYIEEGRLLCREGEGMGEGKKPKMNAMIDLTTMKKERKYGETCLASGERELSGGGGVCGGWWGGFVGKGKRLVL